MRLLQTGCQSCHENNSFKALKELLWTGFRTVFSKLAPIIALVQLQEKISVAAC